MEIETDNTLYSSSNITYEGKSITCIISAEINLEDGTKHLLSLEFINDDDELIDTWGWDSYLIENVYFGAIKPEVDGEGEVDRKILNDLRINGISEEELPTLKEMFEIAMKLGYFDDYMKKLKICL